MLAVLSLHFLSLPTGESSTFFWPGTGWTVALALVAPRNRFAWLVAGNVAATLMGTNALGVPPVFGILFAVYAVVEPVVVRLVARALGVGPGYPTSVGDHLRLTIVCLSAPAASAVLALVSPLGGVPHPMGGPVETFMNGSTGSILVTPLALYALSAARSAPLLPSGRRLEAVASLICGLALAWLILDSVELPVFYLSTLPLVYSLFRLGVAATLVAQIGWAVVVVEVVRRGSGALGAISDGDLRIVITRVLLVTTAIVVTYGATEQQRRQRLVAELREREAQVEGALESALIGVVLLRLGGSAQIVRVNAAACRLLGAPAEALVGTPLEAHLSPQNCAFIEALLGAGEANERPRPGHLQIRHDLSDGTHVWLVAGVGGLTDGSRVDADVAVLHLLDVTEQRRLQQRLHDLALTDSLTGLPNREALTLRLEDALESGTDVGVMYCDLDGFKAVNDTFGHEIGDTVLTEVAGRLTAVLRPGDAVCRLGGDEFVLLCSGLRGAQDAVAIAKRVLAVMAAPFRTAEHKLELGVSIGVSVSRTGATPEALLREADAAMYEAKRAGRNCYHVASGSDRVRTARHREVAERLLHALADGEFELYGQPIVSLADGRVVAVETLLRWNRDGKVVAPGEFLAVAEELPVMLPLSEWVVHESVRVAATWQGEAGGPAPQVHVNLSARQFASGSAVDHVASALGAHGLAGDRLVVEVTETAVTDEHSRLGRDIDTLREMGVRVAVDDVGTGYSSLARITELPVDVLKIDKRFVQHMADSPAALAVVRAVVGIGFALGCEVVAEGVELPEQVAPLREMGCHNGQGFLWARPAPMTATVWPSLAVPTALGPAAASAQGPAGSARPGPQPPPQRVSFSPLPR